jgi:hypothetical protein
MKQTSERRDASQVLDAERLECFVFQRILLEGKSSLIMFSRLANRWQNLKSAD